jgi:hypothetical protein
MAMSACDWKHLGVATKSYILAIHFGCETHSDIRCRNLVEKMTHSSVVLKICHLKRLACMCVTSSMRSTPTSALETLLMLPPLGIFIEMESRQAIYRLKCIGRFKQARVGHSEVFTKMTEENPHPKSGMGRSYPFMSTWYPSDVLKYVTTHLWVDFTHPMVTVYPFE